jgi:hypothetical protein
MIKDRQAWVKLAIGSNYDRFKYYLHARVQDPLSNVHLAKRFQKKRFFRNQPIRNNNCLWRPCLVTDRDKMSTLYRGCFNMAAIGNSCF